MAWIDKRKRTDGGTSALVKWRLGGGRDGKVQTETFGAGSDEQNVARAEGFQRMVEAAGGHWPEGWVKGEGFVRDRSDNDPYQAPPAFHEIGREYVRQIVDITPGQRKRYLSQINTLAELEIREQTIFTQAVTVIEERDVKAWLIDWDRSLKTKANYHGLMFGIFNYAVEEGFITVNPCRRTAPKRRRVRESQADLRFLSEPEFAEVIAHAAGYGQDVVDLLTVTVGTGLRYGEVTALWRNDYDPINHTVRVNKAWKREGEGGETDIPTWLKKQVRPKHTMRDHYLGNPKTPRSRRTIAVSPTVAEILERRASERASNDFLFTSPKGKPLHNSDFYVRVWRPLMDELDEAGIAPFRFHDLRHSHVAWLIAGGAPLPHIQARLGHESITTTIDTYGHLLPAGDELITQIIDLALEGKRVRPALQLLNGGLDAAS